MANMCMMLADDPLPEHAVANRLLCMVNATDKNANPAAT
jgi:hypothetical protein